MSTRVVALVALFSALAHAQTDPVSAFTDQVKKVAGAEWSVRRERDTITLSRDVMVAVPNAPTAGERERHTVSITLEILPYLDDATQRAELNAAHENERKKWRNVSRLVCEGMEFSDHYEDGLCFRPKTPTQERNVAAYRTARNAWLDVPRYHRGNAFSVTIRQHDLEPTEGSSGECAAMVEKLAALLTPYPESK